MRIVPPAIACALLLLSSLSCSGGGSASRSTPGAAVPAAPRLVVDAEGGTPKRGPGDLYNACERVWCLTHLRNFALDHFLTGHVGWILHDEAHGDVFVPRDRGDGVAFPQARSNVLRLCGRHVHPAFLGAHPEPVRRPGYNLALGYDRAHFAVYGTQVPPCCLNEQGWGFLHAGSPREYRFGDRTSSAEMAGSGWQKAFPSGR